MGSVLANLAMPSALSMLMPAASSGQARTASTKANASSSTGTNSSNSSNSASGLGTTFLSLLAQELQNQDPTAPVDATQMVGQMISLNQLQQLISINQAITSAADTTTAASQTAKAAASNASLASAANATSMLSPSAASAASNQLPFDPVTMMPLGAGNASALAASFNSSINAATMGLSGPSNYAVGGK